MRVKTLSTGQESVVPLGGHLLDLDYSPETGLLGLLLEKN